MKMWSTLLAACVVCTGANAGTFQSGNELLVDCQTSPSDSKKMYCLGYVVGAADMFEAWRRSAGLPACIPEGVQAGQLQDVVVQFIKSHPADRHYAGSSLVIMALVPAFCPPADAPAVSRIPEQPQWKNVPAAVPVKKPLKPLPLDTE